MSIETAVLWACKLQCAQASLFPSFHCFVSQLLMFGERVVWRPEHRIPLAEHPGSGCGDLVVVLVREKSKDIFSSRLKTRKCQQRLFWLTHFVYQWVMDCKRWHNWWTVLLLRSATKSSFQVARELCSLLINSCPSFSKWGKPSVKLLLRNDLTEVVCSSSWQLVLNTECGRQSVAKKTL